MTISSQPTRLLLPVVTPYSWPTFTSFSPISCTLKMPRDDNKTFPYYFDTISLFKFKLSHTWKQVSVNQILPVFNFTYKLILEQSWIFSFNLRKISEARSLNSVSIQSNKKSSFLRNMPNKLCFSYCIKYHIRHYKEDILKHVHLHCGVQWEIPHCPP